MTNQITPPPASPQSFTNAEDAVAYLTDLYDASVAFLRDRFQAVMQGDAPEQKYRAFYPEIVVEITSYSPVDSRLSFGHCGRTANRSLSGYV